MTNNENRKENLVYLGSAWLPTLVAIIGAFHIAITQSVIFLYGSTGAFFGGVIAMHIAVEITEIGGNKYLKSKTKDFNVDNE